MYFAYNGKVYFDATENSSEVLFDITLSRLMYNSSNPIGTRYTVYPDFLGHPIVGVSWYGCVKYCNWITVESGRGEAARCYSEGTTPSDWHPVHLTSAHWTDGFDDSERLQWVQNYAGFRLPMDDNQNVASYYNEWYKAAAWSGTSNVLYGFGRNTIIGPDANYSGSGDPFETFTPGTTPVGYYDGTLRDGVYQTASNANAHGIFDLTGNADEWVNDNHPSSVPTCRGGGWSGSLVPNNTVHGDLQRHGANNRTGFRVFTTVP